MMAILAGLVKGTLCKCNNISDFFFAQKFDIFGLEVLLLAVTQANSYPPGLLSYIILARFKVSFKKYKIQQHMGHPGWE